MATTTSVILTAEEALAGADTWVGQILEVCNDVAGAAFGQGHLPGARWLSWRAHLCDERTRSARTPAELIALLTSMGYDLDRPILVYGEPVQFGAYGMWILLGLAGIDARYLDGGKTAWVDAGGALESGEPTAAPPPRAAAPPIRATAHPGSAEGRSGGPWIGREELLGIGDGACILDLRATEEFAGSRAGPPGVPAEASRTGHIRGARSLPHQLMLDGQGRILPRPALAQAVEAAIGPHDPDDDVVVYCRSGHRSSLAWLALTHRLGWPRVRVYEGAWLEWANLSGAPVETGGPP